METVTEWRVIWFPWDVEYRERTGSEKKVRELADEHREYNPIISSRTVQVSEWMTVENYADRGSF